MSRLFFRLGRSVFFTLKGTVRANNSWTKKAPAAYNIELMSPASWTRKCYVRIGLSVAFTVIILGEANSAPTAGEYALSGPLNGDQTAPSLAFNAAGGFFVCQDNGIDGNGLGIAAKRLDAGLSAVGSVFRINQTTEGDQEKPHVSLLQDGGAAICYQGGRPGLQNIYARFLKPDGSFLTGELIINPAANAQNVYVTTNWLVYRNNRLSSRRYRIKQTVKLTQERNSGTAIATLADGSVVVAYASGRSTYLKTQVPVEKTRFVNRRFVTNSVLQHVETRRDTMQDVYFQIFSASGQKVGPEMLANQFADYNQSAPSVAALPDGTFVITWLSEQQRGSGSQDIYARHFNSTGGLLGDEVLVNTELRACATPSVAGHVDSGFTIVWTEKTSRSTDSLDIRARTYSPTGNPITTAYRVNEHLFGDQFSPAIASSAAGQMVVWTSLAQDGSREGVYGRLLNNGSFSGSEFRVNTTTHLRQFHPAVTADASGRFSSAWASYQTLAGFDVFGQRFSIP